VIQTGFAVADITPPEGAEMPGGFFPRKGKLGDEKLWAVACVATDGTTPVALVGIDALFVTRPTVEQARRIITRETRIPGENVLIGANHSHTGGPIAGCLGCTENPEYMDAVARGVARAVADAWNSLHASEVAIATGREDSILFNRRFVMRDGREITHPGKPGTARHKDIVAVAGPVDPAVGVLAARNDKGKVTGLVVNWSCHSTVVGGEQFHPDYTAYLRKHLRAAYGDSLPVCFLLGACGDVTQVDNLSTAKEFGHEHADLMGRKLAAEVVRVVNRAEWLKDASTACDRVTVPLGIREEPDVERERPAFGLGSGDKVDEVYAEERKKVADERKRTPVLRAEVQAIRIGPLGIVTNGAEYFAEYALRIKQCSPLKPSWVSSLTNEWLGYVPTAQAFVGGGYEPRTARSSKLSPDAGQRLVEGALEALDKVVIAKDGK
jgi:hypothetical protein